MTPDQRAALERLLEYVGRGFCAVQADCKVLREFLAASAPTAQTVAAMQVLARQSDTPDGGSRLLIQAKRPAWKTPTVTYAAQNQSAKPKAKKPTPTPRKR